MRDRRPAATGVSVDSNGDVKSKLTERNDQALIEATQALGPEERLNAFLTHCRLIMKVYEAGRKLELSTPRQQS